MKMNGTLKRPFKNGKAVVRVCDIVKPRKAMQNLK